MLLQGAVFIAAAAVLMAALVCLNTMSPKTNHWVRVAYVCIAVGAFAELFTMLNGREVPVVEAVFMIGLGLLSIVDRRARFHCPLLEGGRHEA